MRFGVLYDFRNPAAWRRPPAELYRALLDQIAGLEDLGFDSVWLTEHHFVADGYLPAVFPLAGAIAQRTKRLRIGTYVLLLPLHRPVEIAESAAVTDVLSEGRFTLGVGLGYRDAEFRGLGVARSTRGARMDEAIEIVRRCWGDGALSYAGRHFTLSKVDARPKPLAGASAPIWVGAHTERAIDRAARLGDGWLAGGAGRVEYEQYRAACARHAKPLGTVCALRNVWIGSRSEIDAQAAYVRDLYRKWYGEAADRPVDASGDSFSTAWQLMGEPASVVEQIAAYREELPFDELVMLVHLAGTPIDASTRALRLFAERVRPRFAS